LLNTMKMAMAAIKKRFFTMGFFNFQYSSKQITIQ
jgi:hypothetical protein